MSSSLKPQASPPPPEEEEDPWRLGWRYVPRVGPDGDTDYEQVPLTEDGLLFPEEGDFVVNNDAHHLDCFYLESVLRTWADGQEHVLVVADHRVNFQVKGLRPLGPDLAVFAGLNARWDPNRGTFPVADFGARTLLVVEVTSPDTRKNDVGVKVEYYRRAGAAFYAIVDRRESRKGLQERLLGYHAAPNASGSFTPAPLDERGRLWLEPVRVWLALEEGRAVCYDENGERMPDRNEALRQSAVDKEAARKAERATRKAERATRKAERATREAERIAVVEAEARQAMEVRLREMEAELKRLQDEKGN